MLVRRHQHIKVSIWLSVYECHALVYALVYAAQAERDVSFGYHGIRLSSTRSTTRLSPRGEPASTHKKKPQTYSRGCREPTLKIAGINHLIRQPQGDRSHGVLPGSRLEAYDCQMTV
jgi:hypothetical protein